jgi:hypothetical protein
MEETKQNGKSPICFITGNKCAVWWGSARAHTDSVQKCLILDPKPDKDNMGFCSSVPAGICLGVFWKSGKKSNSH